MIKQPNIPTNLNWTYCRTSGLSLSKSFSQSSCDTSYFQTNWKAVDDSALKAVKCSKTPELKSVLITIARASCATRPCSGWFEFRTMHHCQFNFTLFRLYINIFVISHLTSRTLAPVLQTTARKLPPKLHIKSAMLNLKCFETIQYPYMKKD